MTMTTGRVKKKKGGKFYSKEKPREICKKEVPSSYTPENNQIGEWLKGINLAFSMRTHKHIFFYILYFFFYLSYHLSTG